MKRIYAQRDTGFRIKHLVYLPGVGHGFLDVTDRPWPAVTTQIQKIHIAVMDDGRPEPPMSSPPTVKPTYEVPSMDAIRAIPWNGYTVASTFSGCGGSSLGYRMAGFRVAYANEFMPIACRIYRSNAAPGTVVDDRDITHVAGADILNASNMDVGQLDLLDGSPPCNAFSTAGQQNRAWEKGKRYGGVIQKDQNMFAEFIRLIREVQPRTFIAENVKGLVTGVAKGFFIDIMRQLKDSGYRVSARLTDAQWLGVPQARPRLIFIGVRNDLNAQPAHPKPLPYWYTSKEVLPELLTSPGIPGDHDPSMTMHKLSVAQMRRLCGFPHDFILPDRRSEAAERVGNAVPPVMMSHIAATVRDHILDRAGSTAPSGQAEGCR